MNDVAVTVSADDDSIASSVSSNEDDNIPTKSSNTVFNRLYSRLKLEHAELDNAAGFILIKSIMLCVFTLLIDKGTRNPDSVTTVFVGLMGLSPFLQGGKQKGINTLVCGLLGATIGTLVNAACYLSPETDPNKWMQLISIPWSIGLTQYVLFFVGLDDTSSTATGQFSALFVVVIQFAYPPIDALVPANDPRRLIWQTFLVRVLSLLTAVITSFLINFFISASAPLSIYKTQQYYIEKLIWKSTRDNKNPTDECMQKCFSCVVKQIHLGPQVNETAKIWIFGEYTRDMSSLIEKRSKVIFRYLTFISFLKLYVGSISGNSEEREMLLKILDLTKRDECGNSLTNLSMNQEIKEFQKLPAEFHIITVIFIDILRDLKNSAVPFRPAKKRNLFFGLV